MSSQKVKSRGNQRLNSFRSTELGAYAITTYFQTSTLLLTKQISRNFNFQCHSLKKMYAAESLLCQYTIVRRCYGKNLDGLSFSKEE